MDRSVMRHPVCWTFALLFVSSFTVSRLVEKKQTDSRYTGQRLRYVPPPSSAVGQTPSWQAAVEVTCHPDSLEVVLQADLFGTGLLVDGSHLRLGPDPVTEGSACGASQSGEEELTIWAHLTDCGTKCSSTPEKIIYSNVVIYSPQPSSDGLFRLDASTIPVECHYDKRYAVDAISLQPTWVPYVSETTAENQVDFDLRLMTDDWQFERGSHMYFLGDPIHIEVSAIMGHHMPLRVFVDHCVATATPDPEATLRYDFINHGCLTDASLTNSTSHFLPRVEDHVLRFKLDAFRFHQEPNDQVFIACSLQALPVILADNSQNRACSLTENRWQSVDANNWVCRSCDTTHQMKEPLPTKQTQLATDHKAWFDKTSEETSSHNRLNTHPVSFVHVKPEIPLGGHYRPWKASDYKAERTFHLGPVTVLPSSRSVE